MTVEVTVKCDAYGCHAETEIESDGCSDVERSGFTEDPRDPHQHYCGRCWPIVEKELQDEEE